MNDTEQATDRTAGSVPNAYRNALFWRWAPTMPKGLPSAFVTLLYALAAAADPTGKLKFRDGTVIRIKDIAAACKADEKDVRRYLRAAIGAGVLALEGEQKRGRPNLYQLLVSPDPQWGAALWLLEETRRKSRKAPPWLEEKNGGVSPELPEAENGGHAPELEGLSDEKERGTRPRWSSGDTPPLSSGDTPPNNPGSTHGVSHDGAEVVGQPQVDGPWGAEDIPQEEPPRDDDGPDEELDHTPLPDATDAITLRRCANCGQPVVRPGRTLCAAAACAPAHPGAA